jgi:PucR C-terminal helix-turn-helix domain
VPEAPDRPWSALPAGLADVLRPELPGMTDEIIDAVRSGVPAYARPIEGAFGAGLRVGVEAALGQFVEEVGGAPESGYREVYWQLGSGEWRAGRSLDALLAAYRLGARVAWRRLSGVARAAGVEGDVLSLLAESIFAYIDELSAVSAEGYAVAQSEAAGALERRRAHLVELLVREPAPDAAEIEAVARDAGVRLPRRLAVVAVAGDDADRRAGRISGALHARVAELTCVVIGDPDAPGRAAEVEHVLDGATAAIGPSVEWADAAESFRRARAALALNGTRPSVVRADERSVELLLNGEPRLAADLAARRLAPLDALADGPRARMTETLRAWLDHQGRVGDTAAALHIHPQTVRYRLGKLRDVLGDALEDPRARLELDLALRARET